ncbi:MAG: type IV toxin-antitoxin system AbiEi family antitoxin domain-containing protein [Frankiaceae bacterium]
MVSALAALAATQHSVFTRQQALAAGYHPSAIDRRLRSGGWLRLRHGIYADRALEPIERHRYEVAAALLALRDPTLVASRFSAARLHRLDFLVPPPVGVDLAGPPPTGRRDLDRLVVRPAELPSAHRGTAAGLPATTLARTVIDCGRALPFLDGVVLADSALRRGATRRSFQAVSTYCWNWSGMTSISRAVAFSDPGSESVLESVCRVVFARGGLPPPHTQVTLGSHTGLIGRVDFYWPELATVAEADGRAKYVRPEDLWQEKVREDRLREAGMQVVRLTWAQALGDPDDCCARIRAAFGRSGSRRSPRASAEQHQT